MTETRFIGTEGRIFIGRANDPHPRDGGPCPECGGACVVEVEVEGVILGECDCCGAFAALTRCWLGEMETFACAGCQS